MERGVIAILELVVNVKSDSVEGPNSGLMDVEALRIRVRMEMLSSDMVRVVNFIESNAWRKLYIGCTLELFLSR